MSFLVLLNVVASHVHAAFSHHWCETHQHHECGGGAPDEDPHDDVCAFAQQLQPISGSLDAAPAVVHVAPVPHVASTLPAPTLIARTLFRLAPKTSPPLAG